MSTSMQPITAVFFDLGGTLFRYGGRQGGSIGPVLSAAGIDAAPEEIGRAWRAASEAASARFARERYFLHRDLFRETLERFLAAFGRSAPEGLFEAFHQRQLQGLVEHLPLRDECAGTLRELRDRGLYLSVVSNIDDDYLFPLLDRHGLRELFDHCISSEQARSCKPDPDIFHYSLRKAGRGPHEVLFVGDSLHHDVAGAHRVGMRSARIVEAGVTTPLTHGLEVVADPTYEIASLAEILEIVDGAGTV